MSTDSADAARHTTTTGVAHAGTSLTDALRILPTPTTTQRGVDADADEREGAGPNLHNAIAMLLPTPRAGDGEKGGPNQRGSSGDLMLPSAAVQLVPTPLNADAGPRGGTTGFGLRDWSRERAISAPYVKCLTGQQDVCTHPHCQHRAMWGQYAAAIARWEALTRPAPSPTELSAKGNPRLSAAFSEWLMGLPAGWVTDVPGITRNEALRALGNGVVPQQAEAAVRFLFGTEAVA